MAESAGIRCMWSVFALLRRSTELTWPGGVSRSPPSPDMCKALTSPPSPHRHGGRPRTGRPASPLTAPASTFSTTAPHTGREEANCLGATAEDREAALPPPTITRFVPQPTDPPPFPPPFYRGAPGQGRQRLRGHGWCDLPGCSGRRKGPEEEKRVWGSTTISMSTTISESRCSCLDVISFQQL